MQLVVVACLAAVIVGLAYGHPGDQYTTKYDNLDLQTILKNDRLMTIYFKCLLEEDRCTPEGTELKVSLKYEYNLHLETIYFLYSH